MPRPPRRLLLLSSPLVLVLALGLYGRTEMARLQAEAEALAQEGQAIQRLLKDYTLGLEERSAETVSATYDPAFAGISGGLWVLTERTDEARIDGRPAGGATVLDWRPGHATETSRRETTPQVAGLVDHLLQEVAHLDQVKLKLEQVERLQLGDTRRPGVTHDVATVRTVLWMRGRHTSGQALESKATFRLELRRRSQTGQGSQTTSPATWKIEGQTLLGGTTVLGDRQGFTDIASAAGIDFQARHNPRFDTPEWAPERFGIIRYGSAGVTAADFDGDGWEDLFFADGHRPRLYRNEGTPDLDGSGTLRFADITTATGLPDELPGTNVALALDFDNDGDRDLFLGRFMEGHRLYRNDGPADDGTTIRWTDVSDQTDLGRGFVVAAAAADYDLDGDLDLYLGRYLDPRSKLPTTLFYTRNGEGNTLLRNDGDLRFTDVTDTAGVAEGGLSLGIAWGDVDDDGDPDLYVANDFGRNALLRNEGDGTFRDVSEATGSLDFGFGMSAAMGDVDNDGDLDVYVSNVRSGQRWYSQATTLYTYLINSLRQGTIRRDFGLYREIYGFAGADWHDYGDRMVKGNSLLVNQGAEGFVDLAETAGANPFGWYWASNFLDYDNDGWLDVYSANGWISGVETDDL